MVTQQRIRDVCKEIARQFRPDKIILFGSNAYGTPRPDSDVDLLVILKGKKTGVHKAVEILEHVDASFGLDLIVRTPAQIRQRLKWNDFFLKEVIEKGRVLYESPDTRVG